MKKKTMYAVYVKNYRMYEIRLVRCFSSKELAEDYKKRYIEFADRLDEYPYDSLRGVIFIAEIDLSNMYGLDPYDRIYFDEDYIEHIKKSEYLYIVNARRTRHAVYVLTDKKDVEKVLTDDFNKRCVCSMEYTSSFDVFKLSTDMIDNEKISVFVSIDLQNENLFLELEPIEKEEFKIFKDKNGSPTVINLTHHFMSIKDMEKPFLRKEKVREEIYKFE